LAAADAHGIKREIEKAVDGGPVRLTMSNMGGKCDLHNLEGA
jgi:hypothetical protein